MSEPGTRYERIGHGYARLRREDPRTAARVAAARVAAALGDARTVANVGAGAGSYEPRDRYVIAIESSDVMAAQRPPELPPAIRATAGRLPLRDDSVDAAMAILTIHHWDAEREAGVRELRRVATGPVAILKFGSLWAHPERVLDRDARNATSGFARTPPEIVDRVVRALERDLSSGEWDRRHARLRELEELDVGLRLVVGTPE
jgi:SAM-dependent methyltransferase